MSANAWIDGPSGPYQVTTPTGHVTCYSRRELYDVLDGMTQDERVATTIRARSRYGDDDGQYVHAALGFEVNAAQPAEGTE